MGQSPKAVGAERSVGATTVIPYPKKYSHFKSLARF